MKESVLITGATGGIGSEVARKLAEQGTKCILVSQNEEKLEELRKELAEDPIVFPMNLKNIDEIQDVFDFLYKKQIKLNGLVHCAGINNDHAIKHNDYDMMQNTFKINYFSFVEMLKCFLKKRYSHDGASVVALSSYTTFNVVSGQCQYASSKAALEMTVKIAAKEALDRSIRINAIAPNYVNTKMTEESIFTTIEEIDNRIPFGIIEPKYIADVVSFLLSDSAKYITGAVIPVSAGVL